MKTQKGNVVVIVLIVIIVAATAGYIGWKFSEQFQGSQQGSLSQTVNQTPVQPDETRNWNIYKNEKYGFTMSYPSSWPVPEPMKVVAENERTYISDGQSNEGCCSGIRVEIWDITADERYNSIMSTYPKEDILSDKLVNTNGSQARELVWVTHYGDDERVTLIALAGKTLELGRGKDNKQSEKIISTVKFTNTLPVGDDILWQAYMNPKNDFGFQYPGGWKIKEKFNTLGYADGIVVEVGGPVTEATPPFVLSVTILPVVYTDVREAYDEQVAPDLRHDVDPQSAETDFHGYPTISFKDKGIFDTHNLVLAGRNNVLVLSSLSEKQNDPIIQKMLSTFILVK